MGYKNTRRDYMKIDRIRDNIGIGEYSFFDHAVKRIIKRSIDRIEIEEAVW